MEVRIGALLVEARVLSEAQVEVVLERQIATGEPFGLICERLLGVQANAIEEAWARQYAHITRTVDPRLEVFEDRATRLVTRRQAWQFRVLPVRFDGRELMVATTEPYLRRALGFALNVVGVPTYLVLAEPAALGEVLCRIYPLPGMSPGSVCDDGMDRLLALVNGEPRDPGTMRLAG